MDCRNVFLQGECLEEQERRWEDDTKINLTERRVDCGKVEYIELAWNTIHRRALLVTTMNWFQHT